jgi:DNA repair protein RadC
MRELSDADLLALLLGLGPRRAAALAERLRALGGLEGLRHAGGEGVAGGRAALRARLEAFLELNRRLAAGPVRPERIEGPDALVAYLAPRLGALAVETFWAILLDARGRPLGEVQVAQGTLTACLVHPREVFAPAIRARAASVIVVHNHPSGDPEPSPEDWLLTERLAEVGQLLGIPLLDHLVIARGGFRSLGGGRSGAPGERRALASAGPKGRRAIAASAPERARRRAD